jgi:hypothetical protein
MPSLFNLPKVTSLPGSKLYFYRTGTSTAQAVYTDVGLSVAHSQPVVADAAGVFAPIYLAQTDFDYRVSHYTSADVLIYTVDDVPNNLGDGRNITLSADNPYLLFDDDNGASNEKKTKILQQGGDFGISILSDDEGTETTALKIFRSGTTVTDIRLLASAFTAVVSSVQYDFALTTSGSFTGALTGYASGPTGTVSYRLWRAASGSQMVTLWITSSITGTSNSTALTMTGVPAVARPGSARSVPCILQDNTQDVLAGLAIVETDGTITFRIARTDAVSNLIQYSASGFTNSGTKGITSTWTITYPKSS